METTNLLIRHVFMTQAFTLTPVFDCCTQKSQEITHINKVERMKLKYLNCKDGGTPDSKKLQISIIYQYYCGGTSGVNT